MGAKIVYNHKAIEKKWHDKWQENPVNPNSYVSPFRNSFCRYVILCSGEDFGSV